jgi:hypothetical protein
MHNGMLMLAFCYTALGDFNGKFSSHISHYKHNNILPIRPQYEQKEIQNVFNVKIKNQLVIKIQEMVVHKCSYTTLQ